MPCVVRRARVWLDRRSEIFTGARRVVYPAEPFTRHGDLQDPVLRDVDGSSSRFVIDAGNADHLKPSSCKCWTLVRHHP